MESVIPGPDRSRSIPSTLYPKFDNRIEVKFLEYCRVVTVEFFGAVFHEKVFQHLKLTLIIFGENMKKSNNQVSCMYFCDSKQQTKKEQPN